MLNRIFVFRGTNGNDRVTILPNNLTISLRTQIDAARQIQQKDITEGVGETSLPAGLARNYPFAIKEFKWQYLFPSTNQCQHSAGTSSPLDR